MANDPNCYYGPDNHESHCFAKKLKDGKQVWAEVRDIEHTSLSLA